MATVTVAVPAAGARRRPSRRALIAGVLVAWLLAFLVYRDHNTLPLAPSDLTSVHQRLNDLNNWVGDHQNSSPIFLYFFNVIRLLVSHLVTFVQALISQPALGLPIPVIGWLGVVALAGFVAWVSGNFRVGLLAVAGFTVLGLQGLWQESMDTLAMTISAVAISLLVGLPLGIWAGLSDRFNAAITPALDLMQIMPTFVYLAPLTLIFLIGPASAAIATLIYAMPPVIRITAHGIRSVPSETVEATRSLGATGLQSLIKVLLPLARRTIILGVNQTIMAALAMVTIAALIDSPGLGQTVIQALDKQDVGTAFNAGLALVVLAIVLDRCATAAGVRAAASAPLAPPRLPWLRRWRKALIAVVAALVAVCVYLSRTYVWAADFPTSTTIGGRSVSLDIGTPIINATTTVTNWVQNHLGGLTSGVKNVISGWLLDPLQTFLTATPFWATGLAVIALALLIGGLRAAITVTVCVALLVASGLWADSMTTLAATLLATVIVMLLGLVFGVWMGRSERADAVIRPSLDAAQVMPSFVYLVPFVALFAASRFTGIVAAVVYAAPVSIKIIADGIRAVPASTVEAATAAGSNLWQLITKVQLPMARSSLTLATNQGLIYVLSMVVVGGLVGGGALGYDVVAGFSQISLYGKGLAAGVAIVLLGIMLDRTSQAAARRSGRSATH